MPSPTARRSTQTPNPDYTTARDSAMLPGASSRRPARRPTRPLTIAAIFAVLIVVAMVAAFGLPTGTFAPLPPCPTHGRIFGIMMDAGSTGSRTHIFQFEKAMDGTLTLIDEVFRTTKPGLSSFADSPQKGAESLKSLMDAAVTAIPKELHHCTPVELKATAGLRLLGETKSTAILTAVEAFIRTYPFKVADKNAVIVMDAADEGANAWLTVNFLLKTHSNLPKSSGIIDLGGASMQVVLHPTEQFAWSLVPAKNRFGFTVAGKKTEVYQHSYLGYGLKEAGNAMVEAAEDLAAFPCFPVDHTEKRRDGRTVTNRQGMQSFDQCLALAEQILRKDAECQHPPCAIDGVHQPVVSDFTNPIYAFSYFYDRLDPFMDLEKNELVSVEDFHRIGLGLCEASKQPELDAEAMRKDKDAPEDERKRTTQEAALSQVFRKWNKGRMCMDLAYQTAVLRAGFGIGDDRKLHVAKKINGVETAWCLGAMLRAL